MFQPGSLFGGAFFFLAGAFLGGAFFFLAGAFLGGAFLFLAGALLSLAGGSLLLRGELTLGDARLPGGALMLRTALLLLPGGVPLLVRKIWLCCAVRRSSASRLWADVVDLWTRNGT